MAPSLLFESLSMGALKARFSDFHPKPCSCPCRPTALRRLGADFRKAVPRRGRGRAFILRVAPHALAGPSACGLCARLAAVIVSWDWISVCYCPVISGAEPQAWHLQSSFGANFCSLTRETVGRCFRSLGVQSFLNQNDRK